MVIAEVATTKQSVNFAGLRNVCLKNVRFACQVIFPVVSIIGKNFYELWERVQVGVWKMAFSSE